MLSLNNWKTNSISQVTPVIPMSSSQESLHIMVDAELLSTWVFHVYPAIVDLEGQAPKSQGEARYNGESLRSWSHSDYSQQTVTRIDYVTRELIHLLRNSGENDSFVQHA